MTSTSSQQRSDKAQGLIPLGTYDWPKSETQQTIGHLLEKIKLGFGSKAAEDAIDVDTLKTVSDDSFETAVRAALAAKLNALLDDAYLDWATTDTGTRSQRLFVHPPMRADVLGDWADAQGLPVIDAPDGLADCADVPCVVIPKLERYFARRHDRLETLFDLFEQLSTHKGRVLVGCNSWALQALRQFDDLRLLLGQAAIFPAFGPNELAAIFEDAITDQATYTSVASGASVFERGKDGALCDPFIDDLVDHSLGHPWVAIEMFFQGIGEAKSEDQDTTDKHAWVQQPAACALPKTGKDILLFALHGLLIHGTRRVEDFDDLLPQRIPNGVWSELDRSGFVDLRDGTVSCAIRNYPDARRELNTAGFNLDRL